METENKRIYLSPPHMNGREMEYIRQAFESNWIAPVGKNIDLFEADVKKYLHMAAALGVNSGTAAMHLALKYLGVGPGDTVFCSDVTFAASCNPIVYLGAEPVFIDSDAESWCMSPALLARALEDSRKAGRLPKAVVVVDLYGLPSEYDEILSVCSDYGVPVVEDAAEALGASYKGRMCGSFGDINVLSFNANKIITTSSGGMVLANDIEAIDKMRYWSTQARENTPWYEHKEIGYNYRLSNICAGIGRGQMESLDRYVETRRRIHRDYMQGLSGLPVRFSPVISGAEPNFWLNVLVIEEDCEVTVSHVADALGRENIETRPFWKPMHIQPVYRGRRFYCNDNEPPLGERLFASALCLPSGSALSPSDLERIIGLIRGCFKKACHIAPTDQKLREVKP